MENKPSKNVSSADNQQERLKIENWILGFTDGEGCFSVSLLKNKTSKMNWQVFPEFVITQGKKSKKALKIFQNYFQCGKVFINKRHDNHREHIYKYCVRSIEKIQSKIIPFFNKHRLLTAKYNDFIIFKKIMKLIGKKKHLEKNGIIKIAVLIQKMNRKKPSRFLKSPETKRQNPTKNRIR
jgi:hypothetical protein